MGALAGGLVKCDNYSLKSKLEKLTAMNKNTRDPSPPPPVRRVKHIA